MSGSEHHGCVGWIVFAGAPAAARFPFTAEHVAGDVGAYSRPVRPRIWFGREHAKG